MSTDKMSTDIMSNRQNIERNFLGGSIPKTYSEGGYGINTQVEKSKNMTIVKFKECDLNKLF